MLGVPPRVGYHDDLELESLRRVDREQPDGIPTLLLRDGLALASAGGLLIGDKAEETLDIRAPQLLVGACEPRQLAQVRIATAAVPARENGQVVVVLRDDPLTETLEAGGGRCANDPVVALSESLEEASIPRRPVPPASRAPSR